MDKLIKIGIKDINNPKLPKGWPKIKESRYNNEKHFAILTGKINDIVVIDLDVHDSSSKSIDWYEKHFGKLDEQETLVTKTKRDGYHIFYKYNKSIKNKINFNDSNVDILTDGKCSYQGELYPVIVDKPIRELNEEEIILLTGESNSNFMEEEINDNDLIDDKSLINILNNLNPRRYDNIEDWKRIGLYLTKYKNGEKIFKKFSQKSDKYNKDRHDYDWKSFNKYNPKDINITIKTLLFWLREDVNEKEYKCITKDMNILKNLDNISDYYELDTKHLAVCKQNNKVIQSSIKVNPIYNRLHYEHNNKCRGTLISEVSNYLYNIRCKKCSFTLSNTGFDINTELAAYICQLLSQNESIADKDTLPVARELKKIFDETIIYIEKVENKGNWYKYNKEKNGIYEPILPIDVKIEIDNVISNEEFDTVWVKWLNKASYQEQLIKDLKKVCYTKIEFDNKEYLLGFKDGVLDLRNMSFSIGNKEDYTTMCCKYSYSEIIESGNLAEEMLRNMFLTEADYIYTLKRLSNCLYGRNKEQTFTINYGFSASNGKSNLMERVKNALGDYGDVFQNKLITTKTCKANEANESLLDFNKKRFLYCSEPEADARLNVNFIKELTGDEIKVRGLYSRNITMKPSYNIFICCNRLPTLDSYDAGIARRIRIVEYPIHFTEKPKRKNEKQIRQYSEEEKEEIERGILRLMIEYYNKEIEEPENLKSIRKMYLNDNKGEIEETLKEMYEETEDKNDYIKLKDIKKNFREIDIISLKYIILSVFPKCEFFDRRQIKNDRLYNIFICLKKC